MTRLYLEGQTLKFYNGAVLGDVIVDVDGYAYWWPVENSGSLSDSTLREIADFLEEYNAEWDAQVREIDCE